jgi:hypothetical protein
LRLRAVAVDIFEDEVAQTRRPEHAEVDRQVFAAIGGDGVVVGIFAAWLGRWLDRDRRRADHVADGRAVVVAVASVGVGVGRGLGRPGRRAILASAAAVAFQRASRLEVRRAQLDHVGARSEAAE